MMQREKEKVDDKKQESDEKEKETRSEEDATELVTTTDEVDETPPLEEVIEETSEAGREFEIVWTTGAQVLRTDETTGQPYYEVLSLNPTHVNLERLNGGAPLLDSHTQDQISHVIGRVQSAWIEEESGEGRAKVKLSNRQELDGLWMDIQDGIVANVSAGYVVHSYEEQIGEDGIPIRLVTCWEPLELSLVSIGADSQAVISLEPQEKVEEVRKLKRHPKETLFRSLKTNQIRSARQAHHTRSNSFAVMERHRILGIQEAVRAANLPQDFERMLIERGVDLKTANTEIMNAFIKTTNPRQTRSYVTAGSQDEVETRRLGMESAILHRGNPTKNKLDEAGRKYIGLTLVDLARRNIEATGMKTEGLDRDTIVKRAFEGTSDFPLLLSNVVNKSLRSEYEGQPQIWREFTRVTSVQDFKPIHKLQFGDAAKPRRLNELEELKRSSISEAGESYKIQSYGTLLQVSRNVILNDDLSVLVSLPSKLGIACSELEGDEVFRIFRENPLMGDGKPIFCEEHKNVTMAPTAISLLATSSVRAAMRRQTGLDGRRINITPKTYLVPPLLETRAQQFVSTNFLATQQQSTNPFAGTLNVLCDARLDEDENEKWNWYMIASPQQTDIFEFAYLNSEQSPKIESRYGWEVLGMEIRVVHDFGVKCLDYRGLHKVYGKPITENDYRDDPKGRKSA